MQNPFRGDAPAPVRSRPFSFVLGALLVAPLAAQSTTRVSVDRTGAQLTNDSVSAAISADGRYVAFVSADPFVVLGDNNGYPDVFVRDLRTGTTVRASVTANGVEANNRCFEPKLSRDGRYVAFSSYATNLAASDANGTDTDVFVKDLRTGALVHASVDSAGAGGNAISADIDLSAEGRFVAFFSVASNLVPGDTNNLRDAFVHDLVTGTTERVSVTSNGAQLQLGGADPSISADGRFVAFEAFSNDFGIAPAGSAVIALRDRLTATTRVLNVDASGQVRHAVDPCVSGDGSVVAFMTAFSLVPADTGFGRDVYVVNRRTGAFEWISVGGGTATRAGNIGPTSLSHDGRYVAFQSGLPFDPRDTNEAIDLFVRDRARRSTDWIIGDSRVPDAASGPGELSADGRYIAFASEASNLVPFDTNNSIDVFVQDRCDVATARSYGNGLAGTGGNVPALGLTAAPVIGTTPALAIGNSAGAPTLAALVIGVDAIALPTPWQGTLLVQPVESPAYALPPAGLVLPIAIPNDLDLCGAGIRLQSLVLDRGAPAGVAFSRGLELIVGG